MKIKLPKIVTRFMLVGAGFAALSDIFSMLSGVDNDTLDGVISILTPIMLLFCPPSLMYMSFEANPALSSHVFVYVMVIALNAILYGLIGTIFLLFFRLMDKLNRRAGT